MSKRRVLVIATTFPRWNGDSEPRFILDFAKSLLPYADVTVLVPSSPGARDKEVMEGVKVERFHYFPVHEKETLTAPGATTCQLVTMHLQIFSSHQSRESTCTTE